METLVEIGENGLAAACAGFYLRGWDYFRSGHTDGAPAREAIMHAVRVLEIGMKRGIADLPVCHLAVAELGTDIDARM